MAVVTVVLLGKYHPSSVPQARQIATDAGSRHLIEIGIDCTMRTRTSEAFTSRLTALHCASSLFAG